ncbi:hypothetical protein SAMN05216316_0517 [Nitrosovibrio sp. Nv6]|nr:hypothetical protein SAMN05216316_0517 [Nitrosovibrio sp. Nv6]
MFLHGSGTIQPGSRDAAPGFFLIRHVILIRHRSVGDIFIRADQAVKPVVN